MVSHPKSSLSEDESQLINKCQRLIDDGTEMDPIEKMRLKCLAKGATGIILLGRALRIMDDDGNNRLSQEKFAKGVHVADLYTTDEEIKQLFNR